MTPTDKIEAITDLLTIPVSTAAQLLGISERKAKKVLPVVAMSYRVRVVTIAACRAYIATHTKISLAPTKTKPDPLRIKILA